MTLSEALAASGLEPREARLLLAAVTGQSQASVLAFPERVLPEDARERFLAFATRRRGGEPVAYILGRKEFYGLELEVERTVLIPRPETELLVELALREPFGTLLDLGTGSGAVAVAIKHHRPSSRVVAIDASAAALEVARRNAARLDLGIDFRNGGWFQSLMRDEQFDVVVSNPPYVASGDPHLDDLGFEPTHALVAGADGLDAIRDIVRGAPAHLAAGGRLLLEHGRGQHPAVQRLLEDAGFGEVGTLADLAGIPRVTQGRWPRASAGKR